MYSHSNTNTHHALKHPIIEILAKKQKKKLKLPFFKKIHHVSSTKFDYKKRKTQKKSCKKAHNNKINKIKSM